MPHYHAASPVMTASKPSPPPSTPHRNAAASASSSHDSHWFQSTASPSSSRTTMGWQASPAAVQWGATPSLLPASVQWGSNTSFGGSAFASSSSHQAYESPSHVLSPPDKSRKSESKRKRFDDDDEDEEMGGLNSMRGSPLREREEVRTLAGRSLVPKRIRAGPGGVTGVDIPDGPGPGLGASSSSSAAADPWNKAVHTSASSSSAATPASSASSGSHVDLGKLLASLDKANLLSLLSSLLSLRPELASTVHSLLPIPTLESVNQSLDAYESDIKHALPFGSDSVRAEYAWNRLRSPVAEMVAGIQGWMEFFRAKQEETSAQNEGVHPSTMFALLLSITVRTIKIQRDLLPAVPTTALGMFSSGGTERGARPAWSSSSSSTSPSTFIAALPPALSSPHSPNLIVTTLLPLLLGAWDALLSRISQDINVESKMLGREVVVSWFRGVEQLLAECGAESTKSDEQQQRSQATTEETQQAMRAVQGSVRKLGTRMKDEIGWTIGLY